MIKKTLLVSFCLILCFQLFSQNSDGDNLFNENILHEIRFTTADTVLFTSSKDYQQLDMEVDGNPLDSVGFKRKGNISAYRDPNKFGIKVKTNKYVKGKKYDGIKEFTLHINYQDPSMMREKLTYELCMEMGLFSLRTAFAKVYINNTYWGLYTLVEGKDEMYKQVFDNRDMDAIESLDFGTMCFRSNTPSDYDFENNGGSPTYVLENGNQNTAWPRFATMIDKANNTTDNQYMDVVSNHLNLEDFFTYQAINVYLMNMDSYIDFKGNQIYMYDTIAQKWQIMPWDFNASFGLWNTNNHTPTDYPMIPDEVSTGCIASKMKDVPELETFYLNAMCRLNSILGDTTTYFSKIDTYRDLIKQAVYDDTRKHCSNANFDQGISYGYHPLFGDNQPALKTLITDRFAVIKKGLQDLGYDCSKVGLTPVNTQKQMVVYPNPSHSYIQFDLQDKSIFPIEVTITNTLGQAEIIRTNSEGKLKIDQLKRGIYWITIQKDNVHFVSRFIKN